MPAFLRNDAIRLLESSQEALHIACSNLGARKRHDFKQISAAYAIEIGLIGAAAEQIMAACVVQAGGRQALQLPSGFFKSADTILSEFRGILRESTAATIFLTDGTEDPARHRAKLLEITNSLRILIKLRAGGLHAGRGPVHEAVCIHASAIGDMLELLSQSKRIAPYVGIIPRCHAYTQDRAILVEDLMNRVGSEKDKSALLASIFLVLPDIPENEPDWINALGRTMATPRRGDIQYLLQVAEQARPAALHRANADRGAIPVRVDPNDPDALPIAPQFLRTQFNQLADIWNAELGTANGRLAQGILDLPHQDTILDITAVGLDTSGVLQEGEKFDAHSAWPAIMSSLTCQGTPGPYWFILRRCGDLGQLNAMIQRAADTRPLTNARARNVEECLQGLARIRQDQAIPDGDAMFVNLITQVRSDPAVNNLEQKYWTSLGGDRELPEELYTLLVDVSGGGEPVGTLMQAIIDCDSDIVVKRYWLRVLADLASEVDDLPFLVALLRQPELETTFTAARKAIRRIDFAVSGPKLQER